MHESFFMFFFFNLHFPMQILNDSIELICHSYFHEYIMSHDQVMTSKNHGSRQCDWSLLTWKQRHDVIDAVTLFEDTLCVNCLFACKCVRLGHFQQAIERNECKISNEFKFSDVQKR